MLGRSTKVEIDLAVLRENMKALQSLLLPQTAFCAVIKADGYGHGAAVVAREALKMGANYLAVAILEEAVALRANGITGPILIMGHSPESQAPLVAAHDLTAAIFSLSQAAALQGAAESAGRQVKVHLKIETGMGRLGIFPSDAWEFISALDRFPNLILEGIFTHFAQADSCDKAHTLQQFAVFTELLRSLEGRGLRGVLRHCANSAAMLDLPKTHLDMVRPGISLYGYWPSEEVSRPVSLRPALKFKTKVAMLKWVPKGTGLSYGCTYVTKEPTLIATLPVGYADGWKRNLSGRAFVLIEGVRAPIVGRICMDQCLVNVTNVPGVTVGSDVLLFGGPELPVEEAAELLGTINYEMLTTIGTRVPRVYY